MYLLTIVRLGKAIEAETDPEIREEMVQQLRRVVAEVEQLQPYQVIE